jgi:hypothetical protein
VPGDRGRVRQLGGDVVVRHHDVAVRDRGRHTIGVADVVAGPLLVGVVEALAEGDAVEEILPVDSGAAFDEVALHVADGGNRAADGRGWHGRFQMVITLTASEASTASARTWP